MYGGHIVELGSAAQVYGAPAHPYTRNLLDSVPIPDPARQRAKLAETASDPDFRAAAGVSEWREISPGHFVSGRFWPGEKSKS
jgi:ABC-type oligopeptide transport system ATPase subunit